MDYAESQILPTTLGVPALISRKNYVDRAQLGGVHKLRLQEEVGRWLSKCQQKLTKVGRWSVLCKR